MKDINYMLTYEMAKDICEHYDVDISEAEDWEICELLDRLIDEVLFC